MSQLDSEKSAKGTEKLVNSRSQQPLVCERWMTLEVQTVKPRDSVARARSVLEECRINQLPVVKDGKLAGIVTDRDLRDAVNTVATSAKLAGMAEEAPEAPDQIPVEAVMTSNVMTLSPHSSVVTAAELMRRERIGGVPIVDGDSLVGIITRSDILEAFVAREHGSHKPTSRAAARKGKIEEPRSRA
jgi:CBS domain-containing protein